MSLLLVKVTFNQKALSPAINICDYSRDSPLGRSSKSLAFPWLQTRDSDLLVLGWDLGTYVFKQHFPQEILIITLVWGNH